MWSREGLSVQANKPLLVADAIRDDRDNAFNLLRLCAATLVFISHENPVTGEPITVPGYLGVYVFFIISGFLIARSWDQRRSAAQYFANRGLRILPALWAVVLITTFVIGPLVTNLSLSKYFSNPASWKYLLNLVFDHEELLPGVFHGNPYRPVNTPLWTLKHEVIFYGGVAVLGMALRQYMRYAMLCMFLYVLVQSDPMLLTGQANTAIPGSLLIYFLGGSLIWYFRDYIILSKTLLALALIALCLQVTLKLNGLIWSLALPYAVLWMGLRKPPQAFRHFRNNDYSYGFYVWGMIAQQCVVAIGGITSVLPHAAAAGAVAALCAYLSWHLIERRALGLKALVINWRNRQPPAPTYQEMWC
jgi:peptidoglycan/LPS O-acetylase OafA/YrhL